MFYLREVMNNLTEGQMLFSVIGETTFKKWKSFPVVGKFISRSWEGELVRLPGSGAVHRNRSYIRKTEGKGRREKWKLNCYFPFSACADGLSEVELSPSILHSQSVWGTDILMPHWLSTVGVQRTILPHALYVGVLT